MSAVPRILILTAAFGEGHNSAARNLALVLREMGATAETCDPCMEGVPFVTDLLSRGYRIITNHFPSVWARMYASADHRDFSRRRSLVLERVAKALATRLEEFRPHAVVTTYPLYPYFLADLPGGKVADFPVFTVVTDSIEINATWLRGPADWWLVTDSATREAMANKGADPAKIVATGFPVHPVFSELSPVSPDDACDPFRVLYFPTARLRGIRRHARALLDASPRVRLTFVLGRNFRHLLSRAKEIRSEYPGRVHILGWTRKVPQLLSRHHLVIGKAGGATVHEAIAACCPMLIHHLVPGQEEGNLNLLEKIGAGSLVDSPEALRDAIGKLLAGNAVAWREKKHALIRHGCHSGALQAARFILDQLPHSSHRSIS